MIARRPLARGVIGLVCALAVGLGAARLIRGQASAPTVAGTPTATAVAPSATAAPTPLPGTPLLREPFDGAAGSAFAAGEDERGRFGFEGGGYAIEVKAPETVVWALAPGSYADTSISVDAELPPGARLAAGVVFHYQDERNFYLFQISGDGYYTLELLAADRFTRLIDWTPSDAIGATANRLQVETRGDRIALFVNNRRLEETRDPSFTAGAVGLAASAFADPGPAVRFDNLVVVQNGLNGGG